jgi:hypothetical protein
MLSVPDVASHPHDASVISFIIVPNDLKLDHTAGSELISINGCKLFEPWA